MRARRAVHRITLAAAPLALGAFAFAACGDDAAGSAGNESGGAGGAGGGQGGSAQGGSSGDGSGASSTGRTGAFISIDGSDGGLTTDTACAAETQEGQLIPANLLFVVDRSGSMNCNLPPITDSATCESFPQKVDNAQPSKWEVTRSALKTAIQGMEAKGGISAGVTMFPVDQTTCDVQVDPNVTIQLVDPAHSAGLQAFLDTVNPGGKTPLAGATILGYQYLWQIATGLVGNRFLVLLTDGFETCAPAELPKLLGTDVPNAALVGIRTFVIGAPGSEDARALLSQMAWEGGTARDPGCDHSGSPASAGDCHFDMTTTQNFAADLQAALDAISGKVLGCEFPVPDPPDGGSVDLGKVDVEVNDTDVKQADCDAGGDGWDFDATGTKIVLCGGACDLAKAQDARVEILLGCPPDVQ